MIGVVSYTGYSFFVRLGSTDADRNNKSPEGDYYE